MGLYKITFMNAGGKTSQRGANFESDKKAESFADIYNSINESAKVTQIIKVISLMSEKKKFKFRNKKFNSNNCSDLTIMYKTGNKKAFNMVIPFVDDTLSNNDLNKIMKFINDFIEIEDIQSKKSKFF